MSCPRCVHPELVTVSVFVIGVAALYTPSAEAAKEKVMSVTPAPAIVTSPDDEFMVATLWALLEKLTTPVPVFVTKSATENGSSAVVLSGIFATKNVGVICLGTKFACVLGVDNTSPVAKVPGAYVATIEGLKMVPKGWELNALSNSGNVWFVIGKLLVVSDEEDGMTCSYIFEPCVTRNLSELIG